MATTRRASTGSRNNGGSHASGRSGVARSPQPRLGQRAPEIQKFGSLRLLPIALSAEARQQSAQLLNKILADTTILYALYKKHHWLVAGPTFYQLHLLFDKHAEEQLELIDLIAERIQSLGGIAVGDPRHAAELTTIERPPNGAEEVPVMIDRLLDAHEIIIEKIRAGLDATEKSKDLGTNDLLMGDVLRRHELQVWFIAEHIVDVPLTEA
jgi:starvation-inducible DNA-binding protein